MYSGTGDLGFSCLGTARTVDVPGHALIGRYGLLPDLRVIITVLRLLVPVLGQVLDRRGHVVYVHIPVVEPVSSLC